jgi:hypothetical protein
MVEMEHQTAVNSVIVLVLGAVNHIEVATD